MEHDLLKTNILAITVTVLLLLITGTALYHFRNHLVGNSRYIMAIPPLGVAAYDFVFNLYRHYSDDLPLHTWDMMKRRSSIVQP